MNHEWFRVPSGRTQTLTLSLKLCLSFRSNSNFDSKPPAHASEKWNCNDVCRLWEAWKEKQLISARDWFLQEPVMVYQQKGHLSLGYVLHVRALPRELRTILRTIATLGQCGRHCEIWLLSSDNLYFGPSSVNNSDRLFSLFNHPSVSTVCNR